MSSSEELSQITDEMIISYENSKGLIAYNLTTPTNPTIYASYLYSYPWEIGVTENYILVSVKNKLDILSNTDPTNPELIGSYEIQGSYISDIITDDEIVYLATGTGLIEIIDIKTPENPILCSTFILTGGSSYGIEITLDEKRSILYVSNDILTIIDVKDRFNPLFISSKSFGERSDEIFYKNNLLFIGIDGGDWQMGGLRIYNVENPSAIYPVSGVGPLDGVGALYADNNYLYFSYTKMGWMRGLDIWDYSNISGMKIVYSNTSLPFISEIKAKYNKLYLIPSSYNIEDNILITFNVSDINNVKKLVDIMAEQLHHE